MYPFLKDASFRPCFCFVHTIAQFSRILRFSHIYCQIVRIVTFVDGSRYKIKGPLRSLYSECITSTIRSEKFQRILFWRNILKSWPREKETTSPQIYSYIIQIWPSEEVNIQNCQPYYGYFLEDFSPREITLVGWQFWIFTDSEGRKCFIIPNKQLKHTV